MATLQCPTQEGGLNILDVKSRNKAIEIIWLKAYLNFSSSHQKWAMVMDHIILATALPYSVEKARDNPFMQTWTAPLSRTASSYLILPSLFIFDSGPLSLLLT